MAFYSEAERRGFRSFISLSLAVLSAGWAAVSTIALNNRIVLLKSKIEEVNTLENILVAQDIFFSLHTYPDSIKNYATEKRLAAWYPLIASGLQSIEMANAAFDSATEFGLDNMGVIYILGREKGYAVHTGKFYSKEKCKKKNKENLRYRDDAIYFPLIDQASFLRLFYDVVLGKRARK